MLGFPWSKQSVTLVKGAVSQKKNRGPVHETNNLSVSEVVKQKVPSLSAQKGGYNPHFLISQGDLQTVYGALLRTKKSRNIERSIISVSDNGKIALDFIANSGLEENAPIVILFPGLSGSSTDSYVICAYQGLVETGYRVIIMNCRGGAGSPLTSPNLTHVGSVGDARIVVKYIQERYPNVKDLFGLGFSMGGGLLSNYLAEEGDNCPLKAGFCVSTVWDLEACMTQIEDKHFLRRVLYSYTCGSNLAHIISKHENVFREARCQGLDELLGKNKARRRKGIGSWRLVRMKTFNEVFMSQLAGYESTAAFAAETSPIFKLNRIRKPCVLLNARDDPFYGKECLRPVEEAVRSSGNENVLLAITEKGGHLGWLQKNMDGKMGRWYIHPIREFFDAMRGQV